MAQIAAFAFGVPSDIYGFYPYTRNSAIPYHIQDKQFQLQRRS